MGRGMKWGLNRVERVTIAFVLGFVPLAALLGVAIAAYNIHWGRMAGLAFVLVVVIYFSTVGVAVLRSGRRENMD